MTPAKGSQNHRKLEERRCFRAEKPVMLKVPEKGQKNRRCARVFKKGMKTLAAALSIGSTACRGGHGWASRTELSGGCSFLVKS